MSIKPTLQSMLTTLFRERRSLLMDSVIEEARKVVKQYYNTENINIDAVEIWHISRMEESGLRYGNLYSYLLVNDINIPYSEMVYEDEYRYNDLLFKWDKATSSGKIIDLQLDTKT